MTLIRNDYQQLQSVINQIKIKAEYSQHLLYIFFMTKLFRFEDFYNTIFQFFKYPVMYPVTPRPCHVRFNINH